MHLAAACSSQLTAPPTICSGGCFQAFISVSQETQSLDPAYLLERSRFYSSSIGDRVPQWLVPGTQLQLGQDSKAKLTPTDNLVAPATVAAAKLLLLEGLTHADLEIITRVSRAAASARSIIPPERREVLVAVAS
jgi:hypothetical protein